MIKPMRRLLLTIITLISTQVTIQAHKTGFVHADGTEIHDQYGNNLVTRSIGTGNWMLQEGYMMQTADVANTQWLFRERLEELIGKAKTDEFYASWLDNHFTRADLDSLKAWGFNSLRPALHYKCFTLPIEDEPISNKQTWLEDGFERLDALVEWCADNQMYIFLDMHGCPGGQGKDAAISDYNPAKPSLWQDYRNQTKLIALWEKIAARYADNPWVGGYDVINETNWDLPGGTALRSLLERITDAIRRVDKNHMIIIEGNNWGNDYTGLKPAWDDNMCYSFHKYWNYNDQNSIGWLISMRTELQRPIWLGESGENSNTWFTDCIALAESNNIGWSFWPVKKSGNNNVLRSITNPDYTALIDYWRGKAPKPTAEAAFDAVMTFSQNHRIENCIIQRDVIDAMIRRPHTHDTHPYIHRSTTDTIHFAHYDLGKTGYAYRDNDDVDYHGATGTFVTWNQGRQLRNDGVDIELNHDPEASSGYSVGWLDKDEWMQYTIDDATAGSYSLRFRYAANRSDGKIYLTCNEQRITETISLSKTGSGWYEWKTIEIGDVKLPQGECRIRIHIVDDGFNLNWMKFTALPTSLDQPQTRKISLSPNPVKERLTVRFETNAVRELELFSLVGEQLLRTSCTGATAELYLAHLSTGSYILRINEGAHTTNHKVVIDSH